MSGDQSPEARREARRDPDALHRLRSHFPPISAVNEDTFSAPETVGFGRARRHHSSGVEQYNLLAEQKASVAYASGQSQAGAGQSLFAPARPVEAAFISEVASHEFNTPITLVLGFTRHLRLSSPSRRITSKEVIRPFTTSGRQLALTRYQQSDLAPCRIFRKTM